MQRPRARSPHDHWPVSAAPRIGASCHCSPVLLVNATGMANCGALLGQDWPRAQIESWRARRAHGLGRRVAKVASALHRLARPRWRAQNHCGATDPARPAAGARGRGSGLAAGRPAAGQVDPLGRRHCLGWARVGPQTIGSRASAWRDTRNTQVLVVGRCPANECGPPGAPNTCQQ